MATTMSGGGVSLFSKHVRVLGVPLLVLHIVRMQHTLGTQYGNQHIQYCID